MLLVLAYLPKMSNRLFSNTKESIGATVLE